MKTTLLSRVALTLTITLGLGVSARANGTPELTIYEVDSTHLTWSWSGPSGLVTGSATTTTPDTWYQVTLPSSVVPIAAGFIGGVFVDWKEPDWTTASPVVNHVEIWQYANNGGFISVWSDQTPDPARTYTTLADGGVENFATDSNAGSDGNPISGGYLAVLNDNAGGPGDTTNPTPDGGTTICLLGMAFLGIAALKRRLAA